MPDVEKKVSDVDRVARAILREVPAAGLTQFLEFARRSPGDLANGNNCGNACGNNCGSGNACIDRFGHLEMPRQGFNKALTQTRELQAALKKESKRVLETGWG